MGSVRVVTNSSCRVGFLIVERWSSLSPSRGHSAGAIYTRGGRRGRQRKQKSDGAQAHIYLRDARRMTEARTSVPSAATPPTMAMPMYPSEKRNDKFTVQVRRSGLKPRTSRHPLVDKPGQALRLEIRRLFIEQQGCRVGGVRAEGTKLA